MGDFVFVEVPVMISFELISCDKGHKSIGLCVNSQSFIACVECRSVTRNPKSNVVIEKIGDSGDL